MKLKKLTMDTDYHDLTWIGHGDPGDLECLFDKMYEAGFDATTWDCHFCGTAMYHSKRMPVFRNAIGWKTTKQLASNLEKWDPLALAFKLGKERNIQVLPYFRLLEEAYAPFDGHEFFRKNPNYWWQSRCGMYRMVGWPCLNYPEVREHMLDRVDELVEHGAEGIFFGLARSHIPYYVPYKEEADRDSFGFNTPVVEEFKRRYGVDLSTFDHVEGIASAALDDREFTYKHRWVGTEPYDQWAFRRLIGEGYDLFLREVRRRYPELTISVGCGLMEAGWQQDEADPMYTPLFRIDLERLCAEKVVDEYVLSMNYRTEGKLTEILLPRFQHVIDSGGQVTAWLNDIFSADGGGGPKCSVDEVSSYIDWFLESKLDGAVIHEAGFLLETDAPQAMWNQIGRFK